jgi:hypothetical protein
MPSGNVFGTRIAAARHLGPCSAQSVVGADGGVSVASSSLVDSRSGATSGIERAGSATDRRGPACFTHALACPARAERLLDSPPPPEQYRACSAFSGNAQAPADHSLARGNRLRRGPCRLSSRQGGASGHRPGQPHPLLGNLRCGISTVHVTSAVSGQLVAMGQVTYRLLEPWPEG